MDDLEAVQPIWEQPLRAESRGLSVPVPPPPAESFQFLLTLQLLAETDFAGLPHLGVDHLARAFGAIRLAAEPLIRRHSAAPDATAPLLADAGRVRLRGRRGALTPERGG